MIFIGGVESDTPTLEQQFPTRFADSISSRDAKNLSPARGRAESLRWLQKISRRLPALMEFACIDPS